MRSKFTALVRHTRTDSCSCWRFVRLSRERKNERELAAFSAITAVSSPEPVTPPALSFPTPSACRRYGVRFWTRYETRSRDTNFTNLHELLFVRIRVIRVSSRYETRSRNLRYHPARWQPG